MSKTFVIEELRIVGGGLRVNVRLDDGTLLNLRLSRSLVKDNKYVEEVRKIIKRRGNIDKLDKKLLGKKIEV